MPTGAQLFADTLQQLGIRRLFTLVGDHLNEALAATALAGIEIIDMRHESAVVHAADAHARITRLPAVSLVTGGPGHTNSLTGLAAAYLAGSPLISISGSRPDAMADRQAFQDIDQIGMAKPVAKWAAQPYSAAQIPFYLARAYTEASAGRKGPVHLTIPVDIFSAEAPRAGVLRPLPAESELPAPDPQAVLRAMDLLRKAQRPIVIAGSGAWWPDAGRELQAFIESTSLPLYTITMARGLVRDDHPLCFGYADPALNRASHRAFQEADLFLILGKRIDFRLGLGSPRVLAQDAMCIQVDIHPQELGMNRRVDVAIAADVRHTLRALIDAHVPRLQPHHSWLARQRVLRDEWREQLKQHTGDRAAPLHPGAFYEELQRALPEETLLSWDGGDFTHWGRTLMPALQPGGWLRLGPLAGIGAALPNGIALKLINPDKPVAVITGDGALGFYLAEMDTAVRHKLPLAIIVGNDAGWGLERELQRAHGNETVACELRSTRYDLIMQAFGGDGETVELAEQIAPAITRASRSTVPYCINVIVRGARSPFTEWTLSGKPAPR